MLFKKFDRTSEPALDVINRALEGDSGARSFLERTTSIYVLDLTDSSKPKTYGCWNFIHQAMNEVERYEANLSNDAVFVSRASVLVNHARLLATMAHRVAKRSPATDKALVCTAIANAAEYSGTESQSQWLVDLNLELREIVVGRIASMAFDFSFHRRSQHSAFADRVVMDTFCAILSANAVTSGPATIRQFATEWIIPSCDNLPAFAVTSVLMHLGIEATRRSAPAGTKETLQQLSVQAMSVILVPLLGESVSEIPAESERTPADDAKIASICLRAIKAWCDATDLSLPQIKHICSKVNTDIVGVLSDAMYSDFPEVVDALADLVDAVVLISDDKMMSAGRMKQVQHIIQVDESSFRAQFSPQQLKAIEASEMGEIVNDLITAIGLQRLRFVSRQQQGDLHVCRNLARIASSVVGVWLDVHGTKSLQSIEHGALELLNKAAGHASVNISAIALTALSRFVALSPNLAKGLLPTLQRRAIIPHHATGGKYVLEAQDSCGVGFNDFSEFRDTILTEVLQSYCWTANGEVFMDSCTSAIEEFCSKSASEAVALQLEAALYCIERLAPRLVGSAPGSLPYQRQMTKIMSLLSGQPKSLMASSLTRERVCSFLSSYVQGWQVNQITLMAAIRIILVCMQEDIACSDSGLIVYDTSARKVHSSATALSVMMDSDPQVFAEAENFAAMQIIWDSVSGELASTVVQRDRVVIASGLCKVFRVARGGPEAFTNIVMGTNSRIVTLAGMQHQSATALRLAHEIDVLASLCLGYGGLDTEDSMESDSDDANAKTALDVLKKSWSGLTAAVAWCENQAVSVAMQRIVTGLIRGAQRQRDGEMISEVGKLIAAMMRRSMQAGQCLIARLAEAHGPGLDKATIDTLSGSTVDSSMRDVCVVLERLVTDSVAEVVNQLGSAWSSTQGNGQEAFESRPQAQSTEALADTLDALTAVVQSSPVFALHLPATAGKSPQEDPLLRRAVDAAAASLDGSDPATTRSALSFLLALAQLRNNQALLSFLSESLGRIRGAAIEKILVNSCGKYDVALLDDAALFLQVLLHNSQADDIAKIVNTALQSDDFCMGDQARITTAAALSSGRRVAEVLHSLWDIHQIEDCNVIAASDEVLQFIQKFCS